MAIGGGTMIAAQAIGSGHADIAVSVKRHSCSIDAGN